jgi:perosamine synthetase
VITISRPSITSLEEEYVVDAVRSGWVSSHGPYVERFEAMWGWLCGETEAISVTNGTAALQLLLMGLGVRAGDEVVVPSLTYVATANAVRSVGAVPVVVDVQPQTWCMDADALDAAVTSRTVGVIAVHAYGHPADMDRIDAVARRASLWVIEDAAEAHLARYKDRAVGALAGGAAFSFYGNKIFSGGEGGAVTTGDRRLAERMRALRNQGVRSHDDRFAPSLVGSNFRLSNLACALLCAQLERRDDIVEQRTRVVRAYRAALASAPSVTLQPTADWATPAPWLFSVCTERRWMLEDTLDRDGIESRRLFPALSGLVAVREVGGNRHPTPVSDALALTGLSLPTYPDLSDEVVERVVAAIASVATDADPVLAAPRA